MTQSQLADRIEALRCAFLKELGDNRVELTALLTRSDQTAPDSDHHKRVLALSHSLAGRGGTFGYQTLSDVAAKANELLESDALGLHDAVRMLIVAVSRVLDQPPHA